MPGEFSFFLGDLEISDVSMIPRFLYLSFPHPSPPPAEDAREREQNPDSLSQPLGWGRVGVGEARDRVTRLK